MADALEYPFGSINPETVGRWLSLTADEDGPVWMLNLMRYKQRADYGDGDDRGVSGREADDAYAPVEVLDALGAMVALFGDVTSHMAGEPAWHRIGIVRYPTRRSFFAMQERRDFREKYVHKQAGMQFTIVMGTLPEETADATADGALIVRVRRFADGGPAPDPDGVAPVARFSVDGVVLGDQRTWDEVRFDRMTPDVLAAVVTDARVEDQIVCVLEQPQIDRLVESVTSLEPAG